MCLARDTLWREEATLQPNEPLSRERTSALRDRFPPSWPTPHPSSHTRAPRWGRRAGDSPCFLSLFPDA